MTENYFLRVDFQGVIKNDQLIWSLTACFYVFEQKTLIIL